MEIEILFEVKKIIFRDIKTGYTIASIYIKKHPSTVDIPTIDTIISGSFPVIHVKDEFKAKGKWTYTEKNGHTFQVSTASVMLPETEKGMIDFLSKIVKGIGKKTAEKIVEIFKENSFNIVMNKPYELRVIKGMSDKKIEALHKKMLMYKDFEEVATFLIPLGVNHTQAVEIYDAFGYSSISIIQKNPYILLNNTSLKFAEVDKIARNLSFLYNNKYRIENAILLLIKNQMDNRGDMFTYYDDLIAKLNPFIKRFGAFGHTKDIDSEKINKAIDYLTRMKKLEITKDKNGRNCVYIRYYSYVEDRIVELITEMNNTPLYKRYNKAQINNFVERYEEKTGLKLAKKQKQAVFMSMENKLSVLTGGPGTGKTHTINTIIECLTTLDRDATVELAAPTGRAAKRITELTGRAAKTIHRLIGLKAGENDEELMPIDADFLIVDEASMIDAYVFYKLLSVVSENTRVLIVGDYDQLPSVGPGLILRDLISSKTVHSTILTEIFRQAQNSQIVQNCHKLIKGYKSTGENHLTFDADKKDFYFIDNNNMDNISTLMLKSIDRLIETGVSIDDIQVLSVMNKGQLGVIELNKRIQDRYNPRKGYGTEIEVGTNRYFRLNDRVMQTVNNYDLEVFNGEVGRIIEINNIGNSSELEVLVDFEDREVLYDMETIAELTLSYAITIHKSQGSEFPYVIMPFHNSLSILLNRNIIYTGWSRAKERVVCVGDIKELDKGVDRINNLSRNSNIKDRLIASNVVISDAS